MEENLQDQQALKKFRKLAEEINICMFLTFPREGKPVGRPMATIKVEDDGTVWFFAGKSSHKTEEVSSLKGVQLIYAHPGKDSYMNVAGSAEVVYDRQLISKYWSPMVKAWFPGGEDDPELCLIKVVPEEAFYWDSETSKIVEGVKIITSVITGKKLAEGKEGSLQLK